ncbi:uncharacterized protein [Venturia canescens]|uniref:uncharacterized protein n=1 Tax=Venturia canescens TaxID=32260 RepID=UPI001C9C8C3C|nr:uncharacterized protein LOC122415217 [Venturia canescens]
MYVDDLLTGASTIEEVRMLRIEIADLLECGGLLLRQWASNDLRVLEGLPDEHLNRTISLDKEQPLKTLGILWSSTEDAIKYSVQNIHTDMFSTKRKILSEIAKIFDPLGLLGPIILYAKCLMQKLWLLKLDWDESVTQNIHTEWTTYCEELHILSTWSYERHVILREACEVQLHGFCDASEKGYGACIYLRSIDRSGNVACRLLCSKSRVALLKQLTIPRLELCAAQLLTKLYNHVYETIDIKFNNVYLWTDSTITLHWINTSSHKLKTFVSNRVAEIQEKTNPDDWRHIPSGDNPADQLSRGQTPKNFVKNNLWKKGPQWLNNTESSWPRKMIHVPDDIPELKKICCLVTTTECELFSKFSSFSKLRRIIAYCLRLKRDNHYKGSLNAEELNQAELKIVKLAQGAEFKQELQDLNDNHNIANSSKLKTLNPFVDEEGILRVGGRLKNAQLPYTQRHPALLPRSHRITSLIIEHHHQQNYHSGIQTTLYAIRRQYWIIDGRSQIRKVIRNCITCFRANPTTAAYTMGNLPSLRVTEARPFSKVGVDYCGPFFIKEKKHRNRGKIKVYVAVFVCLVVKAVHLEVVSDLTTDGFLGALRRFISRRGKPIFMHSDNGTNIVGANNELKELYALFHSTDHQQKTTTYLAERGITWKFIPPLSPNFGGLWESAVKSFKHHFKRVMYNVLLTFEEFNTFAIEIEAILNSRPLCPLSTDPNDLLVLTPGHFLIGDSLTSLPQPDYSSTPENRLSQWEHLKKMRQDYWIRWYKEFLNELNTRSKWNKNQPPVKRGDLVLLKDDHLQPMQWARGRVIETHPGTDGVTRVVTVKTNNSEFKRNVQRLAPLPNIGKDSM